MIAATSGISSFVNARLRKLVEELDEIPISLEGESPKWNRLTLEHCPLFVLAEATRQELAILSLQPMAQDVKKSTWIYAARFRSPLKVRAHLNVMNGNASQAARVRVIPLRPEKYAPGIVEVHLLSLEYPDWNQDPEGAMLPPGNEVRSQRFEDNSILPGEDYIVTLTVPGTAPPDVSIALQLVPTKVTPPTSAPRPFPDPTPSLKSIAEEMHVERRLHLFPQTADGLRQALNLAQTWMGRGKDPRGAARCLESVWDMIPLLAHSEPGNLAWHSVQPEPPFMIEAVRIRNPLDQPADLRTCVISDRFPVQQTIVARSGDSAPWSDSWVEVDYPFEDGIHPQQNAVTLRDLLRGPLLPGHEYLILFTPYWKAMPKLDVALSIVPANPDVPPPQGRHSAKLFGLTLPEVSTTRRDAALERCAELSNDQQARATDAFEDLLLFAAPACPELTISSSKVVWNPVTVEKTAAFRILDAPRESSLLVSLIKPRSPTIVWGVTGNRVPGLHHGFRSLIEARKLQVPDAADHYLETAEYEEVLRGTVLFIQIPIYSDPVELQIAVRAVSDLGADADRNTMLGLLYVDSAPGQLVGSHNKAVNSLAFLSDTRLVSNSEDEIRNWNVEFSTAQTSAVNTGSPVPFLAASAEGSVLVTLQRDFNQPARLRVLDGETLEIRQTFDLPLGFDPASGDISADGKFLVVCGRQTPSSLAVWSLERGTLVRTKTFDKGFRVKDAAWSADGTQLFIAAGTSTVSTATSYLQILDATTFELRQELQDTTDHWSDLAITPDRSRIALLSSTGYLLILDAKTLARRGSTFHPSFNPERVTLSADGNRILTVSQGGECQLWDLTRDRILQRWVESRPAIRGAALAPSGTRLAFAMNDHQIRLYDFEDASIPGNDRIRNSLGMELTRIPAGEFEMGAGGTGARHSVRIHKPFFLATHEVTVAAFREFTSQTGYQTTAQSQGGSHFKGMPEQSEVDRKWTWSTPPFPQEDRHPAVHISWHDAVAFCKWLSQREGKTCRLPTEAEWEYAGRFENPASRPFFWGATNQHRHRAANFPDAAYRQALGLSRLAASVDESDGHPFTAVVASFPRSPVGLFDMSGNVNEWCSDWFDPTYYSSSEVDDPTGPATGTERVLRGGSFARVGTPVDRFSAPPDSASSDVGFRILQEVD